MAGLDLVRSLAIGAVVLGHGVSIFAEILAHHPWVGFFLSAVVSPGVDAFFALSGFLIARQLVLGWGRPGPFLAAFWLRRALRIVPLYLVFLGLNLLFWRWVGNPRPGLFRFLTFTQNAYSVPPAFFPESWSLTIEVWSYLLLPLLAGVMPKGWSIRGRLIASSLALIAVAIAARGWTLLSPVADWDGGVRKIAVFRLDAIAIGALVGLISGRVRGATRAGRLALSGGALMLLGACLLFLMPYSGDWRIRILSGCFFTVVPCSVALVLPWVASLPSLPRGIGRLATWGSAMAYPMYLSNLLIRQVLEINLVPRHVPAWAIFGMYLMLTIGASWAIHVWVERRLLSIQGEQLLEWVGSRWGSGVVDDMHGKVAPEVRVVGWHSARTGVGEVARANVAALTAAGRPVRALDLGCNWRLDEVGHRSRQVHILNVNADGMDSALSRLGESVRPGDITIANCFWETEVLPARWRGVFRDVSELWVASQYLQAAFGKLVPCPVVRMRPALVPAAAGDAGKVTEFALPKDRFNVLYAFDVMSVVERKNPFGVIEAYRRAFGRHGREARLVLKVHQLDRVAGLESAIGLPIGFEERLRREIEDVGGLLITQSLDRMEMVSLMSSADVYLSLHRSEGFGLTMAEAMLLGRPCVATGYSGNLDFMNAGNSHLVAWKRTTLDRDHGPYEAGTTWAEPDLDDAARLLVRVRENRDEALAKAALAREEIARNYSPLAVGKDMIERLRVCAGSRGGEA